MLKQETKRRQKQVEGNRDTASYKAEEGINLQLL